MGDRNMDQKMRIGITTCCWYEEENPAESIKFLNECGFDTIDLSVGFFSLSYTILPSNSFNFDRHRYNPS